MLDLTVISLPVFQDNYIHMLCNTRTKQAVAVDPGDFSPVVLFLEKEGYRLTDILITHHHLDHIGGLLKLKKETNAHIYGPEKEYIKGVDTLLSDHQKITVLDQQATIFYTPGHTLGHICYYFSKLGILFSGDTLFSFGCGRLLEGSAEQLWDSLKILRNLPSKTKVYSAHEYTLNNVVFACSLEPKNEKLKNLYRQLSKRSLPLVPTTLAKELKFNPFLRCDKDDFIQEIEGKNNLRGKDKAQAIFSYIRKLKDTF